MCPVDISYENLFLSTVKSTVKSTELYAESKIAS